jgi:hypothetical protein
LHRAVPLRREVKRLAVGRELRVALWLYRLGQVARGTAVGEARGEQLPAHGEHELLAVGRNCVVVHIRAEGAAHGLGGAGVLRGNLQRDDLHRACRRVQPIHIHALLEGDHCAVRADLREAYAVVFEAGQLAHAPRLDVHRVEVRRAVALGDEVEGAPVRAPHREGVGRVGVGQAHIAVSRTLQQPQVALRAAFVALAPPRAVAPHERHAPAVGREGERRPRRLV